MDTFAAALAGGLTYWLTWEHAKTALAAGGTLVWAASEFVARTPTPPRGSRWARVYHVIEIVARVTMRAKEIGVLPPAPRAVEDFARQANVLLAEVQKGSAVKQ